MKVSRPFSIDGDVIMEAEKLAPGGNLSAYVSEAVKEKNERERKTKEA